MAKGQTRKSQPGWKDVKAKLVEYDQTGLLALVQDLYALREENQVFLHSRLGLGEDPLEPYRATLDRWLWPDPFKRGELTSVSKAKKAITDYKRAAGADAAGLAELMVLYCELGVGYVKDLGFDDWSYLNSIVSMFKQALPAVHKLQPGGGRTSLIARLQRVHDASKHIGYGVGDDIAWMFKQYRESSGDE